MDIEELVERLVKETEESIDYYRKEFKLSYEGAKQYYHENVTTTPGPRVWKVLDAIFQDESLKSIGGGELEKLIDYIDRVHAGSKVGFANAQEKDTSKQQVSQWLAHGGYFIIDGKLVIFRRKIT